jgi:8-oxo-dGTP pyrophosphatase MutT (NUDIX family)
MAGLGVAKNAGILPYTIKDGTVYFLFGLERRTSGGASFYSWNDFGGGCDVADARDFGKYLTTQARLCAAREAAEETRYVFGNTVTEPLIHQMDEHSPEYDTSVRYWIRAITAEFPIGTYRQFFANVIYIDPEVLVKSYPVPHFEKEQYGWVSLESLQNALNHPDAGIYHIRDTAPFNKNKRNVDSIYTRLGKTLLRTDVQKFITSIMPSPTPPPSWANLSTLLQTLAAQLNQLKSLLQP